MLLLLGQLLSTSAAVSDLLGGLVRLAFHDSGSFDGSSGGADGCVDLNATENRGLAPIIEQLAPIVARAGASLSRADVWALAAAVAVEYAGGPQLDFEMGRVDSAACVGHAMRLPDAQQGHEHIREIFVNRLGFAEREVTALMGAHVLGRAEVGNSGYSGPWVLENSRFTNTYFRDLLNIPWNRDERAVFEGSPRHQWNGRGGNTMMLNTDIEIAFDTSSGCSRAGGNRNRGNGDGNGGNGCPRADHGFSAAVTEFAAPQGRQAFFNTFAPAWRKLASLGSTSLFCPFEDCSTPGPF